MLPPSGAHHTWTRDGFLISTDPSLIPLKTLNEAFDSDALYWARSIPADALQATVESSLCFGLYSPTGGAVTEVDDRTDAATTNSAEPALIGFARLITDGVTFAYLTDVYVLEAWRGRKLGEWLVGCVQEVLLGMPYLRRVMAILGEREMSGFYERIMGMNVMKGDEGPAWVIQRRGPGSSFS